MAECDVINSIRRRSESSHGIEMTNEWRKPHQARSYDETFSFANGVKQNSILDFEAS